MNPNMKLDGRVLSMDYIGDSNGTTTSSNA